MSNQPASGAPSDAGQHPRTDEEEVSLTSRRYKLSGNRAHSRPRSTSSRIRWTPSEDEYVEEHLIPYVKSLRREKVPRDKVWGMAAKRRESQYSHKNWPERSRAAVRARRRYLKERKDPSRKSAGTDPDAFNGPPTETDTPRPAEPSKPSEPSNFAPSGPQNYPLDSPYDQTATVRTARRSPELTGSMYQPPINTSQSITRSVGSNPYAASLYSSGYGEYTQAEPSRPTYSQPTAPEYYRPPTYQYASLPSPPQQGVPQLPSLAKMSLTSILNTENVNPWQPQLSISTWPIRMPLESEREPEVTYSTISQPQLPPVRPSREQPRVEHFYPTMPSFTTINSPGVGPQTESRKQK